MSTAKRVQLSISVAYALTPLCLVFGPLEGDALLVAAGVWAVLSLPLSPLIHWLEKKDRASRA